MTAAALYGDLSFVSWLLSCGEYDPGDGVIQRQENPMWTGYNAAEMENAMIGVTWALSVVVALFVGGYVRSYMSKKGENLATHEDIGKLVDQVRAVTTTTKEIEAKISSDVWDRQKQWELKREVLFGAANAVSRVEEQLLRLHAVVDAGKDDFNNPDWLDKWQKTLIEWRNTLVSSERSTNLVSIVCSYETTMTVFKFRSLAGSISAEIAKKNRTVYEEKVGELTRAALGVTVAIRKELGVPTLQSTGSSEAPTAAEQNPAADMPGRR